MKPRAVIMAGVFGALGFLIWVTTRPPVPEPETTAKPPPAPVSQPPPADFVRPPAFSPEPAPVQQPAPPRPRTEHSRASSRRDLANPLTPASFPKSSSAPAIAPDTELAGDFDKITLMFRDYRTVFGENPVGTNAEIMKSIMAGNPKGATFGPPEGQSTNDRGELTDRWGTPYFFHQLTRDLIEVRSAGPDGRMWNDDDITGN